MSERFRHEDVASVPAGWKVRTVTTSGGHRVRVAFPPGRRVKGSGRLVAILHPLSGSNPCGNPCSIRSSNPQELLVMGANPPRGAYRTIPQILNECDKLRAALRHRMNPASLKVGDKVSFHGHDGKDYEARIVAIQRGIAVIRYPVPGHAEEATAYVPRKEWRQRFNPQSSGHTSPRRVFWDESISKYTAHKYLSKYGNIVASGDTKAGAIRNLNAAIARAKSGQRNPQELLIMGANPRVEVVHGENPPVEEIHEEFTGQEVKWLDVYNEPHMPRGRYAQLGPLISLYVKPAKGGQVLRIGAREDRTEPFEKWWDGRPPLIVTDATARQIYFVDGCQDMTPLLEQFGAVRNDRGLWVMGQVRRIDYQCRKEHVAHKDEDLWKHDHGEEDGSLPTLVFDQAAKRMLYEGGNYRIEGPWIRN